MYEADGKRYISVVLPKIDTVKELYVMPSAIAQNGSADVIALWEVEQDLASVESYLAVKHGGKTTTVYDLSRFHLFSTGDKTQELSSAYGVASMMMQASSNDVRGSNYCDDITKIKKKYGSAEDNEFVSMYRQWADMSFSYEFPSDLHRNIAIMTLANCYADKIVLRMGSEEIRPNIYMIVCGESSTTGKTRSASLSQTLLNNIQRSCGIYGFYNPLCSDDITGEGLEDLLLTRDEMITYVQIDEANGFLDAAKSKPHMIGAKERLTLYYSSNLVRRRTRANDGKKKRDALEKNVATAYINLLLLGTIEGVAKALTRDDFDKGLLHRCLWCIVDPKPRPDDYMAFNTKMSKAMYQDYYGRQIPVADAIAAATLAERIEWVYEQCVGKEVMFQISQEAVDIYNRWESENYNYFIEERRELLSTHNRMKINVIKVALLFAAYACRTEVSERDMREAIGMGCEWMINAITAYEMVSASEFSRRCDAIVRKISLSPKGISEAKLRRAFEELRPPEYAEAVETLKKQRRISLLDGLYRAI